MLEYRLVESGGTVRMEAVMPLLAANVFLRRDGRQDFKSVIILIRFLAKILKS